MRRGEFVSVERFRAELDALGAVSADSVTFAGLGEPTLARNLPALVTEMRSRFDLPVVLLTGSGLMPRTDVRRDLLVFDKVVAKLDAPDEATFRQINRPMSGFPYPLTAIAASIRSFRQTYRGALALQMMFLRSNVHRAKDMAALARSIGADEIQLNTPLQPALGEPISARTMRAVKRAFAGLATVCVYEGDHAQIKPRLF
jgi:wyosine [tRNA(Phe)-imidazoG37] synthetase (radical SAM superfamily)